MKKTIILTAIILITASVIYSQADKEYYENETYKLYLKKEWKELAQKCEEALEKGIDYYYIRIRLGIAYYEQENYIQSIKHFEEALEFKPGDNISTEYLYYANKFSGRQEEANIIAKKFSSELKNKTNYKSPEFFNGLYSEGGYTFNSNYSDQKKTDLSGNADIKGEQKLLSGYRYFNFLLLHKFGNRFSISHGYTNIDIKYLRQYYEKIEGAKDLDASTIQNEYYIFANLYLGGGFNLMGSFHYLNLSINDYVLTYRKVQGNDKPFYDETVSKRNDEVFGLYLSKYAGNFKMIYSGSYSSFNDLKQFQNGLSFIYFPLGNLNLYFISDFVLHSQNKGNNSNKYTHNIIFNQKAGIKLSDFLWFEGSYTTGKMENYSEEFGYVVFNNFEPITRRFTLNLISPISNKIELSLRYQNMLQDNTYKISTGPNKETTYKNNNLNNSIIGGLKWTF